ncbi:glycosyltransferase family 2 protein [Candidatus Viridilinea mediisalina]|uniref:Glycosyl transferase n=1 Tax=Candidatus Viridilinea mediisalina TaxID=2024553 RepID=A0A2A6RKP1_9CHLR|nr:glycosyltransferase family 2 protein [Candidatus Viridilinea mediisalina]PDW03465.1 glycosyl transferase [Candidatus Viridilinea mediisalina]
MQRPLLSIIMPCYNEAETLPQILERVYAVNYEKEIIAVDDHSSDETLRVLREEALRNPQLKVISHPVNRGKGAAVRSGLAHARGEITIIQDADLEYDPNDYYALVEPIVKKRVDVVYGSRFMGSHTGMYFWNALGNKGLTFLTNFLFNCWISDMETCYKVMRTEIIRNLRLESNDFRLEPEITAKVLKRGYRILEVPISYIGRTYEEGKKMKPSQGFYAILALLRYRLAD